MDMAVELEADLNADLLVNAAPTNELVTKGLGRNGMFGHDTALALAKDPVLWWKTWGSVVCPELITVVMRVLAQPRSASSAERVWSAYGRVHTDARTGCRRAKKLVKVYFNGRALEKVLTVTG